MENHPGKSFRSYKDAKKHLHLLGGSAPDSPARRVLFRHLHCLPLLPTLPAVPGTHHTCHSSPSSEEPKGPRVEKDSDLLQPLLTLPSPKTASTRASFKRSSDNTENFQIIHSPNYSKTVFSVLLSSWFLVMRRSSGPDNASPDCY